MKSLIAFWIELAEKNIRRVVPYVVMTTLLGLSIQGMVIMQSGAPFWILLVFTLTICLLWVYIGSDPRNFRKLKVICKRKNLARNILALIYMRIPKFYPLSSKTSHPEKMIEFLFRRIKEDLKTYKNKMCGRVVFWVMRFVIVLVVFYAGGYYILDLKATVLFPSFMNVISAFVFTVVLTGSVSYVLSYFGYRAVWERIEKTDLGEMKECAISIWKNMKASKVTEGFKVHKFPDRALAISWGFIDKDQSILQIDFRIFYTERVINGIYKEGKEMKKLLDKDKENWWDYRIVIRTYNDGSYSKMIDYNNVKVTGRSPIRVCNIDGNYRDHMKYVMETVQMLKSKTMKDLECEWKKISQGHDLNKYDAESYD